MLLMRHEECETRRSKGSTGSQNMTTWELRARVVLWAAKLMRIPLRELRDSYPYNPLVQTEVDEAWKRTQTPERSSPT